jgi:hypothetical protein
MSKSPAAHESKVIPSAVADAIYLQAFFIVVGQVALPVSVGSLIGVNTSRRIRRRVGVWSRKWLVGIIVCQVALRIHQWPLAAGKPLMVPVLKNRRAHLHTGRETPQYECSRSCDATLEHCYWLTQGS